MDDGKARWSPEANAWLVLDDDAVEHALKSEALSAVRSDAAFDVLPAELQSVGEDLKSFYRRWPLFSDPPLHTSRRALASAVLRTLFTHDVRRSVVEAANGLAHDLRTSDPPQDSVARFAHPFALAALRRLFGLHGDLVVDLERHAANLVEFIGARDDRDLAARAGESLAELRIMADELVRRDRSHRNVVTIAQDLAEQHGCSPDEALAVSMNLMVDGYFPIESSTAAGVLHIVSAGVGRVDAGGALLADTAIALATPFKYCGRRAKSKMMISSCAVAPGERVRLMLGGEEKERMLEPGARHLAFGRGSHRCPAEGISRFAVAAALLAFKNEFEPVKPVLSGPDAVIWRDSGGYRAPVRVGISWTG